MSGNVVAPVESKTHTYHGHVGSRRTAGRRGGVGQDWMPTEQFSPEARISESLCQPMEEHNERLTSGLSAGYPREEKRSLSLAVEEWTDAFLFL